MGVELGLSSISLTELEIIKIIGFMLSDHVTTGKYIDFYDL